MTRSSRTARCLLVVLALWSVGACATVGGEGRAPARPGASVDPALLPPPPEAAPGEVTAAWEALRRGEVPSTTSPMDSTPWGRVLAGWRLLLRGDVIAAREEFQAAWSVSEDLAVAAYGMGLVAERNGEPEVARRWYERAEEIDPTLTRAGLQRRRLALQDVAGLLVRAERQSERGDHEAAMVTYREISERAPELPGTYLALSRLYSREGNSAAAIGVLEDGVRRAGEQPALLRRLGELYRRVERYREAADVFQRLADARPESAEAAELAREARREYELAALPEEYRDLADKEVIDRADLAALLAIELDFLERRAPDPRGIIIADAGDSWAAPYIQRTVEWGLLDVYQNGAFLPEMEVRRSMLVEAVYEALELLGLADAAPRPRIEEPPPAHVLYRPVQAVVGYELIPGSTGDSMELLGLVSGEEALRTAERVARLARDRVDVR